MRGETHILRFRFSDSPGQAAHAALTAGARPALFQGLNASWVDRRREPIPAKGTHAMPKLLVIDDDRTVLYMISQAFNGSPVSVLSAQTAEQGLELISQHPDVVLLDIVLPGCSGLDIVHKIRDRDPKLPVIFITARGSSDTAIEAMKLGAYDYLLKPLHLPKLRELVDRALQIPRLDAGARRSSHG